MVFSCNDFVRQRLKLCLRKQQFWVAYSVSSFVAWKWTLWTSMYTRLSLVFQSLQRFGSQEPENSVKKISCLPQPSCTQEESQMQISRSSSNLMRKWNSASVTDHRSKFKIYFVFLKLFEYLCMCCKNITRKCGFLSLRFCKSRHVN